MNDTENPYAPPTTQDLLAPTTGLIRIEGKSLVVPKGYIFPAVCLKTGATDDLAPRERRKFSWSNPKLALLILINLFIYAIVAAIVSKRGEVQFQLSRNVARKRRNTVLRNWGLFLLAIGCFVGGGYTGQPMLLCAGAIALLLCVILGFVAARFLWPQKVDATHIWIRGIPENVAEALVLSQSQPLS